MCLHSHNWPMLIDRVILPVLFLIMSLVFVLQFIPLWFYMLFFCGGKIHPIYPPILITQIKLNRWQGTHAVLS